MSSSCERVSRQRERQAFRIQSRPIEGSGISPTTSATLEEATRMRRERGAGDLGDVIASGYGGIRRVGNVIGVISRAGGRTDGRMDGRVLEEKNTSSSD